MDPFGSGPHRAEGDADTASDLNMEAAQAHCLPAGKDPALLAASVAIGRGSAVEGVPFVQILLCKLHVPIVQPRGLGFAGSLPQPHFEALETSVQSSTQLGRYAIIDIAKHVLWRGGRSVVVEQHLAAVGIDVRRAVGMDPPVSS